MVKGLQQTGNEIKAQSVAEKGIRDLPTKGFRIVCPPTVRTHSGRSRVKPLDKNRECPKRGKRALISLPVCRKPDARVERLLTGRALAPIPCTVVTRLASGTRDTRDTRDEVSKGGTPRSPLGRKRRHTVPEQGVSRPQWAPVAMGGAAKRSEPVEEPQRRRRNTRDIQPIVILSREPHGNARSPSGTGQNGIGAKALPMRDAGDGQGLAADRQ